MVSEEEKRFLTVLAEMVFPTGRFGSCVIEQRLGTCTGCWFEYVADCHLCCKLMAYREETAKDKRRIRTVVPHTCNCNGTCDHCTCEK
jgi:hypothetical protein